MPGRLDVFEAADPHFGPKELEMWLHRSKIGRRMLVGRPHPETRQCDRRSLSLFRNTMFLHKELYCNAIT
jgi:hypothetical protein